MTRSLAQWQIKKMSQPIATTAASQTKITDSGTALSGKQQVRQHDSLTMFQAAPIVWFDHNGNRHAFPMLDFDSEKKAVMDALEDAKEVGANVEVRLEVATTDRLSAFMATGRSPVLHFSCHGDPQYLAIEDGWGAMQQLTTRQLRDFISAGSGDLKVVFVSACHSRLAGQAFIDAGVDHVVCCKAEHELRDSAAIVFTKNFYRALACGKTLKLAFQLALKALAVAPSVEDPHLEVTKFLLLPEKPDNDPYHDVSVFYTAASTWQRHTSSNQPEILPGRGCLPPPPELFLGREIIMYDVLEGIRNSRLVRLRGQRGVGRTSLAKAVCAYVHDRSRACSIHQVFWFPPLPSANDIVSISLQEICGMIKYDCTPGADFTQTCGKLMRALGKPNTLVIVDARGFDSEHALQKLPLFLDNILRGTAGVKVLLICASDEECEPLTECVDVYVPPLDIEPSVMLFGAKCPLVSQGLCANVRTPQALADILLPDSQPGITSQDDFISRRDSLIFARIGGGSPALIEETAALMTGEEYKELINIGRSQCKVKSRTELEAEIERVSREQEVAVRSKNFLIAQKLQDELDQLTQRRKEFPGIEELRARENDLSSALDAAVSARAFSNAHTIQMELTEITSKIQRELDTTNGIVEQTEFNGVAIPSAPVKIYGKWNYIGVVLPGEKANSSSLASLRRGTVLMRQNTETSEYAFDEVSVICAWLRRLRGKQLSKHSDMEKIVADLVFRSHDVPTYEFENCNNKDRQMYIWQYEIHVDFDNGSFRVIATKHLGHSWDRYTEPDSLWLEWLDHVKNEEIIDAYCAFQVPSGALDTLYRWPKLLSEIQMIEKAIKTVQTKELSQLRKIVLTDARKDDVETDFNSSTIRLFVWCAEGINEVGTTTEQLSMDDLSNVFQRKQPPEIAVVCMTYGAMLAAKKLNESGVKKVIWLRIDPFSKLLRLSTTVFLPFAASFCSGSFKFDTAFEDLRNNAVKLDPRCQCDCYADKDDIGPHCKYSRGSTENSVPDVILKVHSRCTVDWFQSKDMKRLKLDLADLPLLEDVKNYALMHGKNDECRRFLLVPHFHGRERKETWDRARSISLYVCSEIACTDALTFDNGIHRVASKTEALNLQASLRQMTGRALVWVDFVDKGTMPFDSVDMAQDWILGFGAEATLILLVTSAASCFEQVESILSELIITGDYGELEAPTGLEITGSNLSGVLSICPLQGGHQEALLDMIDNKESLCSALVTLVFDIDNEAYFDRDHRSYQLAIYRDDDKSTKIRISINNLAQLKRLLDIVYVGEGSQLLSKALSNSIGPLKFDCSSFAACYEKMILQLESLTDHQREKLSACSNLKRVHIKGGAGSGKTFLALNSTLEYLGRDSQTKKHVLYVCRNASLAYHFAKWLCHRFLQDGVTNSLLSRICFLAFPMVEPLGFKYQMGTLKDVSLSKRSPSFGKIVVDEAHDIFRKRQDSAGLEFRDKVSDLVKKARDCEVMLLSDVSQASVPGDEIAFPEDDIATVELTQVCRSSKRIIGGAMSYQLSARGQISFAHESDGLPLRSYLFPATQNNKNKFRDYAEKIVDIINDILSHFHGLELHDRLAIIVPDEDFRSGLCEGDFGLSAMLYSHREGLGQHLIPKRALDVSRMLNITTKPPDKSWIVVDSVSEMDGLERLLVLGVGLDEAIGEDRLKLQLVRSRIYRAFTRAHLLFYLINERVKGGWFEWLDHLDSEMSDFSFEQAVKLSNDAATDITSRDSRSASVPRGFFSDLNATGHLDVERAGRPKLTHTPDLQHVDGADMKSTVDADRNRPSPKCKLANAGIWDVSGNVTNGSYSEEELCSDFIPVEMNRDETNGAQRMPSEEDPRPEGMEDRWTSGDTGKTNASVALYPHMVKHLQRSFYTCYLTNGKISTKRLIASFSDPRAASLSRRMTSKAGITIPEPPDTFYDLPDNHDLKWLETLIIGPGLSPCVNTTCHKILTAMGDKPRIVNTLEFFEVLCTMPSLRGVDVKKVIAAIRIQENSEAKAARQTHRGMLTRIKDRVPGQRISRREWWIVSKKKICADITAQQPVGKQHVEPPMSTEEPATVKITFGNTAGQVSKDKEWYEWSLFVNPHGYKLNRVRVHMPPPFRQKKYDLVLNSDGVFRSLTYNGWDTIVVHMEVYFDDEYRVRLNHELGFNGDGCFSVLEVAAPV